MNAEQITRLARQTGFTEYQIQTYLNRVAVINPTADDADGCIREAALFGIDLDLLGVT